MEGALLLVKAFPVFMIASPSFVGTLSSEGQDRLSLSLDDGLEGYSNQNALVEAVAAAQSNTAVVLTVPGAILTPWASKVKAILTDFMSGQQCGNAISDVLLGAVNPSGKLPLTFPNRENETDFTPEQWPGLPDAPLPTPKPYPKRQSCTYLERQGYAQGFSVLNKSSDHGGPPTCTYSNYTERLLVGYRFYDYHQIKFTTGFPFGHGLSYTEFKYSGLIATDDAVSFTLENTGKVAGAEVVQMYLGFPAVAGEPPRQLKGFQKVVLAPGATQHVKILLTKRDVSIFDVDSHAWKIVPGTFGVFVGSSSRDVRLSGSFISA